MARPGKIVGSAMIAAAFLLAGCAGPETGEFTTNQTVVLRAWDSDDAPVTATVPKGTSVERLAWVSSGCACWLVRAPEGTGWVYTRFLDLHLADEN
jgi:hypothetical protein